MESQEKCFWDLLTLNYLVIIDLRIDTFFVGIACSNTHWSKTRKPSELSLEGHTSLRHSRENLLRHQQNFCKNWQWKRCKNSIPNLYITFRMFHMDLYHSYLVDLFYSMYWLLNVVKKVNIAEVFFCWVVTEGGWEKRKLASGTV